MNTFSEKHTLDLSKFHEEGYVLLKGLVDPDVVKNLGVFLNAQIEQSFWFLDPRLIPLGFQERVSRLDQMRNDERLFANLDAEKKNILFGHFDLKTRLHPELTGWLRHEAALKQALCRILDSPELYMHMPPMARFIYPNCEWPGVPAHQDAAYNKHMSDFVTMWIPLTDIDDACGGVTLFEGLPAELKHSDNEERKVWFEAIDTQGMRPVHFHMKQGDALFFKSLKIHQSRPNISDRIRLSMDMRFFGGHERSSKHFLDLQTMKIHVPA